MIYLQTINLMVLYMQNKYMHLLLIVLKKLM